MIRTMRALFPTMIAAALFRFAADTAIGAVLYQDSFDNVAAGGVPAPLVGSYLLGQARVGTGPPAAPSSPNYLDNDRTSSRMGYTGDLLGGPLLPGAVVHAEIDVFANSGYSGWGLIENGNIFNPHDPLNGSGIIIVSTSPNGSVQAINSAGGLVATGLTHQLNTWEKWQLDYTVGADSFKLTIGNNSANLGAAFMKNSSASTLGQIFNDAYSSNTRALLDNVLVTGPENSQPDLGIGRGRQNLLEHGLQIKALVMTEDDNDRWDLHFPGFPGFQNVNQLLDANFTGVNFWHNDTTAVKANFQAQAGDRPWQWGRITQPGFAGDLTAGELDYYDNFVSLSYEDELPQTQANLDAEKVAFARWKELYPKALIHQNLNWGTEGVEDEAGLRHYMQYTKPDMLMFDMYPGYNHFTFLNTMRNTWYSTMQRYRKVALEGHDGTGNEPLPYGQYLDLWRRESASGTLPSESFVRMQQFVSWAFGFTYTEAFVYNTPPGNPNLGVYSALFNGDGDTTPSPVFAYVTESNRQSLNLGPALLRLVSSDVRMIPGTGRSINGTGLTAWNASANGGDNYITSIVPTQSAGGVQDATYSDIVIGYFRPLLADNSDYPFADGTHFMIVNAAHLGTAAASAQWYRITFDLEDSEFDALERLSRDTGLVEQVELTHLSGSTYFLDLNLPGGTGDLFRLVTTTISGDFNRDGSVDAADYTVWRNGFGSEYTTEDYNDWKANFGRTSGSGTGGNSSERANVPEPTFVGLLIAAGWCIALARRSRR